MKRFQNIINLQIIKNIKYDWSYRIVLRDAPVQCMCQPSQGDRVD